LLEPFRELWDWRGPILLGWRLVALEADLEIRSAVGALAADLRYRVGRWLC